MNKLRQYLQRKYLLKNRPEKNSFRIPVDSSQFNHVFIFSLHDIELKNAIPAFKSTIEELLGKKPEIVIPALNDKDINFTGLPKEHAFPDLPYEQKSLIINLGGSDPILLSILSKFRKAFIISPDGDHFVHLYSNLILKLNNLKDKNEIHALFSKIFNTSS